MRILAALFLAITTCSSAEPPSQRPSLPRYTEPIHTMSVSLDSLLKEFTQKFCTDECKIRLPYLKSVKFDTKHAVNRMCKSEKALGCAYMGWPITTTKPFDLHVLIDEVLKAPERSWELRQVVFHELGHALLALPHDDSNVLNIMFPSVFTGIAHYADKIPVESCELDTRFNWVNTRSAERPWCVEAAYVDMKDGCFQEREQFTNINHSETCDKLYGDSLRARDIGHRLSEPIYSDTISYPEGH